MAVIEFEGIQNARDLGGIPVCDDRFVTPGLFIRSGALNCPTEADKHKLVEVLGVVTVLDLRTGWEREAKPDMEIEGITNIHNPFFDLEKVGIEYEKPAAGTQMVGKDFACDPSDFYETMANPLTAVLMGKGLSIAFENALAGRATLLHCSGGKDRAGILSLLILTILGARREDILEDYLLTNIARDKNIQPIYERFLRIVGDPEEAQRITDDHRAKPSNLEHFYASVEHTFGGMDAFIRNELSISDDRREQLRKACTQPRG